MTTYTVTIPPSAPQTVSAPDPYSAYESVYNSAIHSVNPKNFDINDYVTTP
jgi:hypothetical protein